MHRFYQIKLAVIILLITLTYSETDLSNNNCPEEFNITQANTTTGIGFSEISLFFFSPFTSTDRVSEVEQIIITGDTVGLDNLVMGNYLYPFMAIAIAFGVTYFIVLLCIVFEKSCPPCHSWRRDFSKRPYQKFEIRCVAIFAIIFSIGIFVTSIVSFTIVPELHSELEKTKCGIYNTLDIALNGDGSKWGGFSHIKNQVGNISKLLPSTSTQINTFFDDSGTLPEAMEAIQQTNLDVYSQQSNSTVLTPDPSDTTAAVTAGDPVPRVPSYFIETKLGPNGTSGTMVNDIDKALRSTKQLSDQSDQIIKSAYIIVESAETIQFNTANSQQLLTMYQQQLNTLKTQIDAFSLNYFQPIFNWGIYLVEVVIGFILVSSLAIIIGAISVQILNIHECRYFLHCGWVVYGVTYFGVVFIAFFTMPMASVGYTFCQYFNASLSDEAQFSRIGQYYSQNPINKIDVCLFGDGNVLKQFQIEKQMNTVALMFENIVTFNAYENSTNQKYVDQSISSNELDSWKETLTNYRDGVTKDANPLNTDTTNAVLALDYMNSYTLWTTQNDLDPVKRCSRDRWVYHSSDCLATQNIYTTPSDATTGKIISMDYDTCIPLHTSIQDGKTAWTLSDITQRYMQLKSQTDCQTAYNKIVEAARSITNYRDSRIRLFQSLIDEIDRQKNLHDTFIVELDNFRTNLGGFVSATAIRNLNNFVTNQIDGLLISSQCQPIGDRMRFIHNSFCVNAMGSAVKAGLCMIVLMALMIGGLFTGCVFAQRVATVNRLHKIHEDKILELPQSSQHAVSGVRNQQTFVKLQKFSRKSESESSSSSSEED